MPELGRTKPCAECPWLRTSARGWLGASNAEEFYRTSVTQEGHMPCHMDIDYTDKNWRETQLPEADLCAGNLIYYRNHLKNPRDPEVAEWVRAVERSPHVFDWPVEFMEHHMFNEGPEAVRRAVQKAQWPYP
jgi:hypothetical protein